MEIIINNSPYSIQRVFAGKQMVTDLIKNRVCEELPKIPHLTESDTRPYNKGVDCSIVRRHNG